MHCIGRTLIYSACSSRFPLLYSNFNRSFLLSLLLNREIYLIYYIQLFLFQIGYQKQFYHKIIPDTIEINENMVDKPFTILMTRDRLHNVVISIITVNFYKRCLLTQTTSLHWYLEYIYLTRQFNIDYNILNYVNQFSRRSSRKKEPPKASFTWNAYLHQELTVD